MSDPLTIQWAVGFRDQGLGHGSYGIIIEDKTISERCDIPCPCYEIADHIVRLHNKEVEVPVNKTLQKILADLQPLRTQYGEAEVARLLRIMWMRANGYSDERIAIDLRDIPLNIEKDAAEFLSAMELFQKLIS